MAEDNKYVLQSVETALSILDLFIEHDELGVSEIATLMGTNRSKIFRFLVTLEKAGYLLKNEQNKYRLSAKLSTLGHLATERYELIGLVHPFLVNISGLTGETSHLAVMNNKIEITYIDRVRGTKWLAMETPIGYTTFAHMTASGKVLLAFSGDSDINTFVKTISFSAVTNNTITDAKSLLEELSLIKERGYAIDNEEAEVGLTCYAMPVIVSGRPIAAISVSGPTTRMILVKDKILEELKHSVEKIEASLGA